ncbi:MAG: NTP transferase domain-containing protein [Vulcanimicrobiaceae bacterium]
MATIHNAVITAGGRIDGAFAARAGTGYKALAPIRGVTPLASVIAAARGAGAQRIAVVGDDEIRRACQNDVDLIIADTGSGSGNVRAALRAWPQADPLLYLTSDMPYIDSAHLVDVLSRIGGDTMAMPLTSHAAYSRRFPSAPRAGIRLRSGTYVNGGVFVIPPGVSAHLERLASQFFDARKSPLRMARLVGLSFLLAFLTRRLDIPALEGRCETVLGVPVCALQDAAPELGFDIDDLDHYVYACENA